LPDHHGNVNNALVGNHEDGRPSADATIEPMTIEDQKAKSVRASRADYAVRPATQAPLADARRLLANCSLFVGLTAEQRHGLIAQSRLRNFRAGETIFLMGSAGDSLLAVLKGKVGIGASTPDGREIRLATLQPGEFFGEIALLDGKERSANAVAMTACSLAILERRDVLAFFDRHPAAWPRLVETLCRRLRLTDQHIAEVALLPLPVRLAKVLTRIAMAHADPATGRPRHQVQLSQNELGKIVGATRETVNRCFKDWRRSGIVDVDDGVITILDRAALEQLAQIA
jgi:CRP/FNR family cyclic AMP-dependent transcriptional regulator